MDDRRRANQIKLTTYQWRTLVCFLLFGPSKTGLWVEVRMNIGIIYSHIDKDLRMVKSPESISTDA